MIAAVCVCLALMLSFTVLRVCAQVVLKFQNGAAVVPLRELRVTESSESVLAGTKRPPFRLVVRAIKPDGRRLNIRPAVSEEFVVCVVPLTTYVLPRVKEVASTLLHSFAAATILL